MHAAVCAGLYLNQERVDGQLWVVGFYLEISCCWVFSECPVVLFFKYEMVIFFSKKRVDFNRVEITLCFALFKLALIFWESGNL